MAIKKTAWTIKPEYGMKNIAGKRQILIYSHTTLNSLQIHKMHFHIPINLVTAFCLPSRF